MATLRKVSKIIDVFVFLATTLAIAGVFYEGMTLKWYDIVGILVICMDYSFIPATIIHLIVDRKGKMKWFHVFSMVIILVAIVMKIAGMDYPAITLVLWYFYIWFLYGALNIKTFFNKYVSQLAFDGVRLYEAIFIPEGVISPDREIIEQPELKVKNYHGQGIGTQMMNQMLPLLKDKGYSKASLVVQKANYAVRMYEKVGFKTVDENEEEYLTF